MTFKENPIVELFSSVRFAFFIISLLVVTSIIGTILPQDQPLGLYVEKYGQANAIILEILGFTKTYTSIWFQSLLLVLCLNLVVCSLDRVPQVIKFIKKDNLSTDIAKLRRNKGKIVFTSTSDTKTVETAAQAALERKGWKTHSKRDANFFLLFSEKCAWSRLGAYLVHISILVIILGAVIGSTLGFKAFVMVPEGEAVDAVTSRKDEQTQIPLPFTLRCDAFDIEYYANGMPKEYRSDLVALQGDKEVVKKRINVNDPLTYSGLTFYQSSYEPVSNQYTVQISKQYSSEEKNQLTGIGEIKYVAPFKKHTMQNNQVRFEIVETGADGHGHGPYKVWLDDELGEPVEFVAEDKKQATIKRGNTSYSFMMKQRFATGLQVVKDPGVWIVYGGFGLMLFGMYVAFFMSHRRLWISIQKTGATVTIILSGSSNKNQAGFSKTLEDIAHGLLNEKTLELRRI
jgi:cytochrome c biogenesis protein